jgi:hypothetical protein
LEVALKNGHLATLEDTISVEVLTDLVGLAEALIEMNYMLAAGVVLRSCTRGNACESCVFLHATMPSQTKPKLEQLQAGASGKGVLDTIE